MSNNDVLTAEEFEGYSPPRVAITQLEACRQRLGLAKRNCRVLDWGCGRGGTVLWLREQGYDAYGADVNPAPFSNGRDLFRDKGYAVDDYLALIAGDGATSFAEAFFHVVLSYQVLEHIADLETATREIRRISAPGAEGIHIFPAHRRMVESHLFMPFIHWLPKNRLRKYAIGLWVLLGVEPRWRSNPERTFREKVLAYFSYSVTHTFYRPPAVIRAAFAASGFSIEFVDLADGGFRRLVGRTFRACAPSSRPMPFWVTHSALDVGLVTRLPG